MRLPGRIAAAIEVLSDMETRHRPAALALKDWGNNHRFAGSGDRAAIGNLVYDALRRRASHAFLMDDASPRALVLSVAIRDWNVDLAALQQEFTTDNFAPEPITEQEAERLSSVQTLADAPDHVRANVPEWLVSSLQKSFGDDWVHQAEGMCERPSLDMRVNSLKADRDKILKVLQRFDPIVAPNTTNGVRIEAGSGPARTPNVQADEAYLKGLFEVQDSGSQIVAELASAEPGQQVLDYCAGAGGKTLALAAAMQNKGQIFAHDADRNRLAPIYDRLKRNGARNVQTRPPEPGALDNLVGKMDLVLVDAPCSGTGTWRRRPDTKWRLTPEQLQARLDEQSTILKDAAAYVRPGGHLVYITCSVLAEENDDQIAAFLEAHPQFAACDLASGPHMIKTNHGVMLTPITSGTDGFFTAKLVRQPD